MIEKLSKDIFHSVLRFLDSEEILGQIRLTCKQFNQYSESMYYNISIGYYQEFALLKQYIEKLRIDTLDLYNVEITENDWKIIEHVRSGLCLRECTLNDKNNIQIPKRIRNLSVINCSIKHIKNVFQSIDTKNNIDNIEFYHEKEISIEIISHLLSLNCEKIVLNAETNTLIDHSFSDALFDLSRNNRLKTLCLNGFDFKTSNDTKNNFIEHDFFVDSIDYLSELRSKKFKLEELDLSWCRFFNEQVLNAIGKSLNTLSLYETKVDDNFIKKLSDLKQNASSLKSLDISRTSITNKCVKHLNLLCLEELHVSMCALTDLVDLNMPKLKILSLCDNELDDDGIVRIFSNCRDLEVLSLSCNQNITDLTLSRIYESDIKLKRLHLSSTSVTLENVVYYLEGAKLESIALKISESFHAQLLKANVVLSEESITI
jgi:hypothetical protein